MTAKKEPKIEWDGKKWLAVLPLDEQVLETSFKPPYTYVWRVRESGTAEWSVGFETPYGNCTFANLKPDTEYQVRVCAKNDAGEGNPAYSEAKTNSEGRFDNVISFPSPDSR